MKIPLNRVSMGAQTFSDERLAFIHRRHNAHQVREAVENDARLKFFITGIEED